MQAHTPASPPTTVSRRVFDALDLPYGVRAGVAKRKEKDTTPGN